ncbi:MAG: hypothetical protein WDW38_003234 [Sanguina aurantia]
MPSARRLTRPSKTKEEEEEEEEEKGRHRRSQRLYHFLLHGPLHVVTASIGRGAWKLPERRLQQGSHDTRATATYTWRGRGGWADMSYRERPRRLAVFDHSGCGRRPPAERSGTWAKN